MTTRIPAMAISLADQLKQRDAQIARLKDSLATTEAERDDLAMTLVEASSAYNLNGERDTILEAQTAIVRMSHEGARAMRERDALRASLADESAGRLAAIDEAANFCEQAARLVTLYAELETAKLGKAISFDDVENFQEKLDVCNETIAQLNRELKLAQSQAIQAKAQAVTVTLERDKLREENERFRLHVLQQNSEHGAKYLPTPERQP